MQHREETVNTLLALTLSHYGLMAEAEIIRKSGGTKKLPDIYFKLDGLDVMMEAKFARKEAAEAVYEQALERLHQGLAHITIAIIYPEHLRNVATTEVETVLQTCELRFAVLSETTETDWMTGDIAALVAAIRQAQTVLLKDNLVQELAESLSEKLFFAAHMWIGEPRTCEGFAQLLGIYPPSNETKEQTVERHFTAAKVAMLVLANALIFQEQLTKTQPKIKNINEFLDEKDDMLIAAQEHWHWIWQNINYVPIFQLAENIVKCIPNVSPSRKIPFRNLIREANKIVRHQAALRHDLMGRIYHWLLYDAKYLGTFYTAVPTATLLLKLSIALDKQRDFGDIDTLKNYRVTDLACGTGTLLMAAADALRDAYIRRRVAENKTLQQEDLQVFHKILMEDIIYGYDVLPTAVHLTASTLALLAPQVAFGEMNLFVMPMGLDGKQTRLGSLDFFDGETVQTQFSLVGDHVQATRTGAAKATAANAQIPSEKFDLCVMNPPFVRSVGGNLLFGSLPDERQDLQKALKKQIKTYAASATAGLGSVFIALADKYINKGGRLAFVLPVGLVSGEAWASNRILLAEKYHLEMVITSHDPTRYNFSENTDLSELLFIARRLQDDEQAGDTIYLNLWRNPDNVFRALDVATRALQATPPSIETAGVCSLRNLAGDKLAEVFTMPPAQQRENWVGALFAQTDLVRVYCHLQQRHLLMVPGQETIEITLCALHELAAIGPDQRRVHDGFKWSTDEWSPYEGFWNHDSKTVTQIAQTPNVFLNVWLDSPRGENYGAHLWKRAGQLLVVERLRINTHKLAAIKLSKPVLCNTWWALNCDELSEVQVNTLALWLNSSIAILLLFGRRVITEGAWVKLKQPAWKNMPVLDVRSLKKAQLNRLAKQYDKLKDQALLPIAQLNQDPVRKAIDDALSKVLDLPDLSNLRELLAREPGLTGKKV